MALLASDDSDMVGGVGACHDEISQLYVLGGEASVSDELVDSIAGAKQKRRPSLLHVARHIVRATSE